MIVDSPLLLGSYYNQDKNIQKELHNLLLKIFNSYNNLNFFLNGVKPYNPIGRLQTEEESNQIAKDLINFLQENNIDYSTVNGDIKGAEIIIDKIMKEALKDAVQTINSVSEEKWSELLKTINTFNEKSMLNRDRTAKNNNFKELLEILTTDITDYDLEADIILAEIAGKISAECIKRNMTKSEFAKFLNIDEQIISKIENGDYEFSIRDVVMIANILNLDYKIIFGN